MQLQIDSPGHEGGIGDVQTAEKMRDVPSGAATARLLLQGVV